MTNNTTADLDRDIAHLIECSESGIARVPRETLVRLRALLTSPRAGVPAPKGWKLVPIEPTQEMLDCWWDGLPKGTAFVDCTPRGVYGAMLDAAPAAPVAEISAGTEPNPSKESGQSEAVISARGFDDQAVAADGTPSDDLLQLDVLLADLHAAVWHAGAGDDGPVDYDMAGKDEAKAIQRHVRAMLAERAAVSPATADERAAFVSLIGYERPETEGCAVDVWDSHRTTWSAAIEFARASQGGQKFDMRTALSTAKLRIEQRSDDEQDGEYWSAAQSILAVMKLLDDMPEFFADVAAAPAEARESSVVASGLIGLARHVRAVPAYSKLVGDMDIVDQAIAILNAARAQGAQGGKGGEA
ncbi:hypothetical protein [Burkholderia gladioli]|uniref:hypothetical protein n=1 Tax=Burkholderia gladioli TaxID=28095 RepID=UPI00164012D1|nr:hypothetical protein [Burkholderia gladioli]